MIPPANSPRVRPALGLAVIAAVIIAAAVAVLAVAGDDDGPTAAASTSSTASSGGSTPDPTGQTSSSTTAGATTASSSGPTTTTTLADRPAAPWRATVARNKVPADYAQAWDRARNRNTCALLFPLDGGPEMPGATASADATPNDNGWDIFLTSGAATIEILGLFDKASQAERTPGAGGFTRTWADGSEAKYSPDSGGFPGGPADPNTGPFEAVLILPDQGCAYRIYDSLGRNHLEALFDRLRLMAP